MVVAQKRPESPLAVGSAFKLGILAVLADRIAAGEASWRDVIELRTDQVSLPSGQLQAYAVGSPFTLHTLAAMMISISDNTATDMLLDYAGRDAVASKLGVDFVLKTRELFQLKADADKRAAFLGADAAGKQAIVETLAGAPLPSPGDIGLHNPGVEYYVPLETLCALASDVAGLDVFAINPGIADPADWASIAFKGGSEQGVLNFTTHLRAEDGATHCVAMSWNAPQPLDEAKAATLYAGVIKSLLSPQAE